MNKTKLLTIAVIVLIILNVSTLVFIAYSRTMHRGPRHQDEGPRQEVIAQLHFDKQQQQQYGKLIEKHQKIISQLDRKILETKNRLYLQLIKTSVDNQVEDSLITVIVGYQKQIEEAHFKHFHDLKKICKPGQLEYYYDLTTELTLLFSKKQHEKHD